MAPAVENAPLVSSRAYYGDCPSGTYQSGNYCYSSWSYWGRWVFAAVVVVVFIIILFLVGCTSARRRRRRGVQPMYGTGWMGSKYGGQVQNNPQYYGGGPGPNYGPPPPQYSRDAMGNQTTGQTFNSNDGYYGHHNEGIQLQQPAHTYTPGGEGAGYAPPPGPPPSKIA